MKTDKTKRGGSDSLNDWLDFADEIKNKLESVVEQHRREEILTCRTNCWCWDVDAVCMKIDQKKSNDQVQPEKTRK